MKVRSGIRDQGSGNRRASRIALFCSLLPVPCSLLAGSLTPSEALKSFRLADDRLTIEVAVSEPQIEDPVAMTFDEDGRMYVVEMRGFQQGPDAKGLPGLGRITRFEDRDGDGTYEHSTVFADNMYYATAVMPAYGGIVVGQAPDVLFLKDTDGDGKADIRKVVYTGFGRGNHEQLLNSFQWGIDNWIHLATGGAGGKIRPGNASDAPPIDIGTRNIRFRITSDGDPAGLETVSSGAQFGLTCDDADHWFTAQNPRHNIQIVLPEEYTKRNPYLAVPNTLVDIPDHGAACKVFRISPLEEWRVVRTRNRAATMADKYPPNELVPGGYITSGCGIHIYRADLLPKGYYGQSFTCEPANNLIHRDRLVGDGPQLTAVRIDADKEFLASTDPWFRPVTTMTGPDGCLYVVDMYREVIETPVSIPPEILKTINMDNGKDMGRIYRIRPKDAQPHKMPRLGKASTRELVEHLGDPNAWTRLTAQRLLFERDDASARPLLAEMIEQSHAIAKQCALWAYWNGDSSPGDPDLLISALDDGDVGVRRTGLRLYESARFAPPWNGEPGRLEALRVKVYGLKNDPSPLVRFQLALSAGNRFDQQALGALVEIAQRDLADPWIRTAILLALSEQPAFFFNQVRSQTNLFEQQSPSIFEFTRDLASIVGARQRATEWITLLNPVPGTANDRSRTAGNASWVVQAVLEGLRLGLDRAGGHARLDGSQFDVGIVLGVLLMMLDDHQPTSVRTAALQLGGRFTWAGLSSPEYEKALESSLVTASDADAPTPQRRAALQFAATGPADRVVPRLMELLTPGQPVEIQKFVVTVLAGSGYQEALAQLIDRDRWFGYTPPIRDAVVSAMLSRTKSVPALLAAIKEGYVPAWTIGAAQRERLKASADANIREAARALLEPPVPAERQKVYDRYLAATNQNADATRGREVFRANCVACHKLEGIGNPVGPDLMGVRDRPADQLLGDILFPSRAVTAGYSAYMIETQDGQALIGIIASESATAITLRQKEGVEATILRSEVKSIAASSLSMMPEEIEQTISTQQMADLIAYLRASK